MALLSLGTFLIGVTGLPFMMSGKFLIADIFSGASLPAATLQAAGAAFPAYLSAANMLGRGAWGPLSDRLGRKTTFLLFGASPVTLCLLPQAAGMVQSSPEAALYLFQGASLASLAIYAGAPVLLAPAASDIFGQKDAQAIYSRCYASLPFANVVGTAIVTQVREYSYKKHAIAIADTCDPAAFSATFGGATVAEAGDLVGAKTVTLPLLLTIAPPGTQDPTPFLYDDAFYTLASCSAVSFFCYTAAMRIPLPAKQPS